MADRILINPGLKLVATPIEQIGFCQSVGVSRHDRLRVPREWEAETNADKTDMGCICGTAIALALEAGAGLCIYGLWRLCHLFW